MGVGVGEIFLCFGKTTTNALFWVGTEGEHAVARNKKSSAIPIKG